jgi:hypothetical protein
LIPFGGKTRPFWKKRRRKIGYAGRRRRRRRNRRRKRRRRRRRRMGVIDSLTEGEKIPKRQMVTTKILNLIHIQKF